MGLFSTLTNSNDVSDATTNKSSIDLPTVVQLYRHEPLLLEQSSPQASSAAAAALPSFAMLSYSAVSLSTDDDLLQSPTNNIKKKQQQQLHDPAPELGVWNVRIPQQATGDDNNKTSFNLLNSLPASCGNTFALTVDLGAPETVEPTMTLLQNALIRFLKERGAGNRGDVMETTTMATTATTSLYDLQSTHFGLAPQDSLATSVEPDMDDRHCKFCLVVLAKVAPPLSADYRDTQVQALLKYHLYKFASQLKAYLVFVDSSSSSSSSDDTDKKTAKDIDGADKEATSMSSIHTPQQVASLLKDLAQGMPLVKPVALISLGSEETDTAADGLETTMVDQELSLYAPDNAEFIDTILLRNANFPGQWDAAMTSLWKILPPPPPPATTTLASGSNIKTAAGDQGWLQELRDSVMTGADGKTPVKTTKKHVEGAAAAAVKTPGDDKNVSSFFESLLN